ncbi:MAG: SulP family inorganic anion transporter, partial [Gammaproteobacteria bacterium]|nr:SulP family inorganic anion transporter [Gammaproteobacteria bacterium]
RLALTLTFMVGVIQITLALARLGALVNFISHSVIIGFTAGAAILIAANQIKNFFGVDIPKGSSFYEVIYQLIVHIGDINPYVTTVGAVTLLAGIISRKYLKKFPYMIVAMVTGTVLALIWNTSLSELETGIKTVGALPAILPPLSSPDFSLATIRDLAPTALAVTLFALVEAVSIARSIGMKSGQHIDGNQEFMGQGLSNLAGSFFSAYVATGSFNRSGLNYQAGAKTPIAAVLAAVFLGGIVLLVAPYASYIPNAAMAAILFLVAWGLIDFHHIKQILSKNKSESAILLTTFFSTLFLELEFAIFLGVMLSLVLYLNRTSKPRVYTRVPDPRLPKREFNTDPSLPECPQLKLIRVDGSLFFGAVTHVREKLAAMKEQTPSQKHLLLLAQGINFVDLAGAEFLEKEALDRRKDGGGFYMFNVKPGVCEELKKGDYLDHIGRENLFTSKREAIQVIYQQHLDKSICASCDKRIFDECNQPSAQSKPS